MKIRELSSEEMIQLSGGDWWERMMGFMIITAFLGGALAMPELLVVGAMTGGSIIGIEAQLTWY